MCSKDNLNTVEPSSNMGAISMGTRSRSTVLGKIALMLGVFALAVACGTPGAAGGGSSSTASPSESPSAQPSEASPSASPSASASPSPSAQPSESPSPSAVSSSAASAPDANTWVMPNLRGQDLQTAQDAIQSLTNDGIVISTSHDATGAGRHQIFDRDWQVCTQNIAPGAKLSANTDIDFGVVRRDVETCP
jgi:hypothetical protein